MSLFIGGMPDVLDKIYVRGRATKTQDEQSEAFEGSETQAVNTIFVITTSLNTEHHACDRADYSNECIECTCLESS